MSSVARTTISLALIVALTILNLLVGLVVAALLALTGSRIVP